MTARICLIARSLDHGSAGTSRSGSTPRKSDAPLTRLDPSASPIANKASLPGRFGMAGDRVEHLVPVAFVELVTAALDRHELGARHGPGEGGPVRVPDERVRGAVDHEERHGDVADAPLPAILVAPDAAVVRQTAGVDGALEVPG